MHARVGTWRCGSLHERAWCAPCPGSQGFTFSFFRLPHMLAPHACPLLGPCVPPPCYLALPVIHASSLQSSPGPGSSLSAFLPLAACDDATLVPLATAALATPHPVEDHVAALKAVGSLLPVNAPVRASEHARCVVSCTCPHAHRLARMCAPRVAMDARGQRLKTF